MIRLGRRRRPATELERERLAIDQLDRAEHYLVAAIDLELADAARRRALHVLRWRLLEVRGVLARPRPLR